MKTFSFLIICTYLMWTTTRYGVPRSISRTYYLIKHRWVFRAVLMVFAATSLPGMLEGYPNERLAFLSGAGIMFVACTPNFEDDEMTDRVHTASAMVTLVASQLWVGLISPAVLLTWTLPVVYGIAWYWSGRKDLFGESNIKFWSEIVMMLNVGFIVLR